MGSFGRRCLILPMLIAVQEACARIGAVTGKGIAATVKERYSKKVLYGMLALILVANTINLGADLGAMGAAAQLIVPVNFTVLVLFFTAAILMLEIFTTYRMYARILKWLCVTLFSYVITVFLVHEPWGTILESNFCSAHRVHPGIFLCDHRRDRHDDFAVHVLLGSFAGGGGREEQAHDSQRRTADHQAVYEAAATG